MISGEVPLPGSKPTGVGKWWGLAVVALVALAAGWLASIEAGLLAAFATLAGERHLAARAQCRRAVLAEATGERLTAAIEALPHGFTLYDPEDRLVRCNARTRELYAASAPALAPGARFEEILRYGLKRNQYAEAIGREEEWLAQRLEAHRRGAAVEQALGDGRRLLVTEQRTEDGSTVGIRIDVTEAKHAEEALRAGEERFRSMAEAALDAIVVIDSEGRVLFWSASAARMFGWSEAEMLGHTLERIMPEALRPAHAAGLRRVRETGEAHVLGRTVELTALCRDGTEMPVEVSFYSWRQGAETFFGSIIRDVTARKHAEARIAHLAYYDALTGLPNRVLLMDRLGSALAAAARGRTLTAVLCLDLDRFKEVNDTRGHAAGDALLRVAAERLRASTREVDTVARLGGDEFAVVQVGIDTAADVQALCERLLAAFAAPILIDDQPAHIGLSIGVALAPVDGTAAEDLLRYADLALYRAKGEGRGSFRMFEPVMDAQLRTRKQLEHELRLALERDEFVLEYQPLVDIGAGRIVGAEALVRWRHPERGLLGPGLFIPLAEQTGLISQLGGWVLREACREASRWPSGIAISVNLSPVQVRQRDLVQEVGAVLQATGLAPARLELEITEGVLLQDDEQALLALEGLKELGVRIALDDFGTGYSSLGYLRQFPFDRLKIDQSFVRDLLVNSGSAAIVRAVIGLARGLAVGVTAEGVENEAQLAFLGHEGCGTAQGFLLGRPMAASTLEARLLEQEERAAPARGADGRPHVGMVGLAEAATSFDAQDQPAGGLAHALGLTPGSLWLERPRGSPHPRG